MQQKMELTCIHYCYKLLSNTWAWSCPSSGTEIKLVACAVLEVIQSDASFISRHSYFL